MSETGPPRPIKGSVGSRVRLILGETGSDFLLIIDEDDGNRQWQSHSWCGIPNNLAKQLNSCTNKGRYVKSVDFGPTDAWFVNGVKRDGTGDHSWWNGTENSSSIKEIDNKHSGVNVSFGSTQFNDENFVLWYGSCGYSSLNLPDELLSRLKKTNAAKKNINFIRLFDEDNYVISDANGLQWCGDFGIHLPKELKKPGPKNDVAYARDGSWAVIRPSTYVTSTGVGAKVSNRLQQFYREQAARNTKRGQEIRDYHARVARERAEREEAERVAAERARVERKEAERRAQEQREREAQEQREKEERERAEQEAKEAAEKEAVHAVRSFELENTLEESLIGEAKDIKDLEEHIRKRRRSLQASVDKMPPERKARIQKEAAKAKNDNESKADCVVCHAATPTRAVIPCGHHCLCDGCAVALSNLGPSSRLCPLCRGSLDGTLKIYASNV